MAVHRAERTNLLTSPQGPASKKWQTYSAHYAYYARYAYYAYYALFAYY